MLDDVVADDVEYLAAFGHLRVRIGVVLPDGLPIVLVGPDPFGVLLRRGDVLDRSVDPHVEDEVIPALAGRRPLTGIVDPPVHIAGNTQVLQFPFDPLAGLILGVVGALEPVDEPLEVLLEVRQPEELVWPGAVLRGVAGDRRDGGFDLTGFEVSLTAIVALVAASRLPAVGTGPFDEPIREGLVGLRVPGDFDLLFEDVVVVDPRPDERPGHLRVRRVVGVAVVVELDVELRERLLVLLVVFQRERLGIDPLLGGVDRDRRPVHVRSADERD